MANTIAEQMYDHLKSKGISVYAPGQKTDECKFNYTVVRDSGISDLSAQVSSNLALFDAMCYVPKAKFFALERYVADVKKAMIELYPMLIPTGFQTQSFYDDTVKAHMISVQYKNYQKKVR